MAKIANMEGNHDSTKSYIESIKGEIPEAYLLSTQPQKRRFLARLKSICKLFDRWTIDQPTDAERLYALQIIHNELWFIYELGCKVDSNFHKNCREGSPTISFPSDLELTLRKVIDDNLNKGLSSVSFDLISYIDNIKTSASTFNNYNAIQALTWLSKLTTSEVSIDDLVVRDWVFVCYAVRGVYVHEGEASTTGTTFRIKKAMLLVLIDVLLIVCHYIASKIEE